MYFLSHPHEAKKTVVVIGGRLNASPCINSIGNLEVKLKPFQKILFFCFVDSFLVFASPYKAKEADTNVDLASTSTTEKVP